MHNWQSIETIPENKTVLLLCNEYKPFPKNSDPARTIFAGTKYRAVFQDENGTSIEEYFGTLQPDAKEAIGIDLYWEPTHWMPLPEMPDA